jgi:transmembrane sensor
MSAPASSPVSLTPEIRAEAAAWVAKLHGSGRTHTVEAAFKTWLGANAAHTRAFEIATAAWEAGGSVASTALPRMELGSRLRTRSPWRPVLAAAMLACMVATGAFFFLKAPTFTTAVGEQRSVTLSDGTRVTLNTDSRLKVNYSDAERNVELQAGEAFFDVAKNPERPFIVTAGHESVVAVGTSFMVRRDGDEMAVTLVEGKVNVLKDTADPKVPPRDAQVLIPGQRLRVAGSTPTLDRPNIDAVTAWRRGEVVLDHTRLVDAVAELNRYSPVKLLISSPSAETIEISGIFRAGDSARFARAIADTYALEVIAESNRIVITGSPRPARP